MAKENKTAGTLLAELLAAPITHHFEQRFTVREVVEELLRHDNDVLVTMRDLAHRSHPAPAVGPSSPSPSAAMMWTADSDLVLAIRWHFDNKFDSERIVRSLVETNGDILDAMRMLHAEAERLSCSPSSSQQIPRPKL